MESDLLNKKPSISIIIPVYNQCNRLGDCLDSILAQSFVDFECLLIDDGSTDGSSEICDIYAQRDTRFKTIHQPNHGVSSARNTGIALAQGEYAVFVDSDDTINTHYLQVLIDNIQESDLSIVGFTQIRNNLHLNVIPPNAKSMILANQNNAYFAKLIDKYSFFGPVCKLYRLNIIKNHGIRFVENVNYGEDLIFNFKYLKHCNSISSRSLSLYNYIVHENSLSTIFRDDIWGINSSQWLTVQTFFSDKGMLNGDIADSLYDRLAGIVYDAIFQTINFNTTLAHKRKALKYIFSFAPLMTSDFKHAMDRIECSKWIKIAIKKQYSFPFITKSLFK